MLKIVFLQYGQHRDHHAITLDSAVKNVAVTLNQQATTISNQKQLVQSTKHELDQLVEEELQVALILIMFRFSYINRFYMQLKRKLSTCVTN